MCVQTLQQGRNVSMKCNKMLQEMTKWVQCDTVKLIRLKTVWREGCVYGSFRVQKWNNGCEVKLLSSSLR